MNESIFEEDIEECKTLKKNLKEHQIQKPNLKNKEEASPIHHGIRKDRVRWDKLDNTANLFPVIASESRSNVWRISVSLTENVDPVLLQEALNRILPWFTLFRMRLRKGVFWYYFEENRKPVPHVVQEHSFPGAYIDRSRNHHYMFRVTYYHRRINLEVFHALTDGYGGIQFLKELLYQYLRLKYPDILKTEQDKLSSGLHLNQEDSYVSNFKKGHEKVYKSEKAVQIEGEKLPKGEVGIVHGYLPIFSLKQAAKRHNVTINQYLVGVYTYAIYQGYLRGRTTKQPISTCVPVNLRPYYNSYTMKNFFAMVSAVFQPERENYTLDEVIQIVKDSLQEQITPQHLEHIMSYNVSNEKNLILRTVPLWVKNIAMRSVYNTTARANSSTITNIGNIQLREPYQKYVEHFYCTISMSKGQNIKGGIVSYNGTLTVTFSSILEDLAVQSCFFRTLAEEGIMVAIESNGVYYE